MDGLNMNFEEFSANLNTNCSLSLVDMGTFNLHVVHESFKTVEATSDGVSKKS